MERRHVIDPYVYMCICLKTTFPIMHCNENRKKDTMRKYCPKMNHRAMEGYCAVEWAANTAHQPTADGRDRGVGFSERVREREWVSVPWAEFCVGHLIWWNGRWSILMYSWIDWRAPCAARGPWNSPKVRRHTIQSIYKHSYFWRLLKLSRRPWIHCSHLGFREGFLSMAIGYILSGLSIFGQLQPNT